MVLCVLGVLGTLYCGWGVWTDEVYYRAALAMEKYPNNVLYTTELKMAEPRHMLLLTGTFASAPIGIILGSICMGIAAILRDLAGGRR